MKRVWYCVSLASCVSTRMNARRNTLQKNAFGISILSAMYRAVLPTYSRSICHFPISSSSAAAISASCAAGAAADADADDGAAGGAADGAADGAAGGARAHAQRSKQ